MCPRVNSAWVLFMFGLNEEVENGVQCLFGQRFCCDQCGEDGGLLLLSFRVAVLVEFLMLCTPPHPSCTCPKRMP